MRATHAYIRVYVEIADSNPLCSLLSHLVFPSLDNSVIKKWKSLLNTSKKQYKQCQQVIQIEKKNVCAPPYITSMGDQYGQV